MQEFEWVYFKGGYGLMDMECCFHDHKKGLDYVADELIRGNPKEYKDMPLDELYMEANADLHKVRVMR